MRLSAAMGIGAASAGVAASQPAQARQVGGLPPRVAALYWTHWNSWVPLRHVPTAYNVVYLFAAPRAGKEGRVWWPLRAIAPDLDVCRARSQRVLLTIGGHGQSLDLRLRADTVRLVESVVRIDAKLGGGPGAHVLDGIDLNTYEGRVVTHPREYIWASRELRRRFGPGFAVTTPPSPWSTHDRDLCRELLAADAVDYVAPQFYGSPRLRHPEYILETTGRWVDKVAGGDARRVVVGFGVDAHPDFSTMAETIDVWPRIRKAYPAIRGAFLWQHRTDAEHGWAFARRVAPQITSHSR